MTAPWSGRWRLVETDLWSDDSIDLLEEAHIVFDADRLGSLVVGALQADIDYRTGERDGRPSVEFSWVGDDDGHPSSGRGWAHVQPDNTMRVKLYIHRGDEVTMIGAKPRTSDAAKGTRRGARRRRS
jgi:hypothetical protein